MPSSAISSALSGFNVASVRIDAASHNVANLQTEDFKPVRTHQHARAEGGVVVQVETAAQPEPVDLAGEIVGMVTASVQAQASLRVVETETGLIGSLLDLTV